MNQSLNRRADGQERWVEWTDRGIFNEQGKLIEIQAVGRDIHEEVRLRRQLEEVLIEMETQAMSDSLTGLLNRRAIMEHAEAEFQRAKREKSTLSLAIVDLDNFKQINDGLGHLAGDRALQNVAGVMQSSMRRYDWVGRWGGDEFLLVLPGADEKVASDIVEALRLKMNNSNFDDLPGIKLSIGLATSRVNDEPDSLDKLVARADDILYSVKDSGRNRVGVAP